MKLVIWGTLSALTIVVAACSSETTCADAGGTEAADGTCTFPEPGTDGGSSSGGGSSGQPDGGPVACDPTVDKACVSEERGVFVRAGAASGGNGAKLTPFPSITAALAGRAGKSFVYVCAGSYEEALVVNAAVSIIGGLDCAGFEPGGGVTRVSPASGVALTVSGAAAQVSLLDLTVEARAGVVDAAAPKGSNGASSIAAFVNDGAQVTAQRVAFVAGAGAPGVEGEDQAVASPGGAGGPGGATFGTAGVSACGAGVNANGGRGGDLQSNRATSEHGSPPPADGVVFGRRGCGADEVPATGQCFGGGGTAGQGREGRGGTKGAATLPDDAIGSVGAAGWAGAAGVGGGSGNAGGGGGGGGQGELPGNNTGGGGGAGGCGGLGGGGGGAGGASIAVLVRDASFTATLSSIKTAVAGSGGQGGRGGDGGFGGEFGAGIGLGQEGGAGAGGGGGAGGNGGAAGLQAGIVSTGGTVTWSDVRLGATTASLDDVTLGGPSAPGAGGEPGAAGPSTGGAQSVGVAGESGNAGPGPVVTAVLQL